MFQSCLWTCPVVSVVKAAATRGSAESVTMKQNYICICRLLSELSRHCTGKSNKYKKTTSFQQVQHCVLCNVMWDSSLKRWILSVVWNVGKDFLVWMDCWREFEKCLVCATLQPLIDAENRRGQLVFYFMVFFCFLFLCLPSVCHSHKWSRTHL